MALPRYIVTFFLAVLVAFAIVFCMNVLVTFTEAELDRSEKFKLPEFVQYNEPDQLNTITPKPKKPPKPEERPEEPEVQQVSNDLDLSGVQIAQIAPEVGIDIQNGLGLAPGDGEYLPIVKVAPVYPRSAQRKCLEGDVLLEFTVTKNGSVKDPVVIQSTSKVFESSAKKAALKFKYKPKTVDGSPIDTPNVRNNISYRMDGCR